MDVKSNLIETGVDKLINLIKEKSPIELDEAAKELGISKDVVLEWVDFLEEEGIIEVKYTLTNVYLSSKKLTKENAVVKAKEFQDNKEIFIRKAESSLNFLKKKGDEFKKIKDEFDRLKIILGEELSIVQNDLKDLEKDHQKKEEIQKKIEYQKKSSKNKIDELTNNILREQKKYKEIVAKIEKEKGELIKEKKEVQSIEESEKILDNRLKELKNTIKLIEEKITNDDSAIKNSEFHIQKLNDLIDTTKQSFEKEKSSIDYWILKHQEQKKKAIELEKKIFDKISQKQKDLGNTKKVMKDVKDFFGKRLKIVELTDKINLERNELEKSLIVLIKKAKSLQLTQKGINLESEMVEMEKKIEDVDKKREKMQKDVEMINLSLQ